MYVSATPLFTRQGGTHPECIQDASGMRVIITLELICTVNIKIP